MLEFLLQWDREIFSLINGFHDAVLDKVMYWASDRFIWIPFYAWLLYLVVKYHRKELKLILPSIALMILITDHFSVFIKNSVMRLRPCRDSYFADSIHLVNEHCGGMYGFISSHAANTMSLTIFLCLLLPKELRLIRLELIAWTILIGYSRIYLGAHFPSDVLAGWILGSITAYLLFKICSLSKKKIKY